MVVVAVVVVVVAFLTVYHLTGFAGRGNIMVALVN